MGWVLARRGLTTLLVLVECAELLDTEILEVESRAAHLHSIRAGHGLVGPSVTASAGVGTALIALALSTSTHSVIDVDEPRQLLPVLSVGVAGLVLAAWGMTRLVEAHRSLQLYDTELRALARRRAGLSLRAQLVEVRACPSDAGEAEVARSALENLSQQLRTIQAEQDEIRVGLPLALAVTGVVSGSAVLVSGYLMRAMREYPEDSPRTMVVSRRTMIAGGMLLAAGVGSLGWFIQNQRRANTLSTRKGTLKRLMRELRPIPLASVEMTGISMSLSF